MIHISCGNPNGIGPECLIKSIVYDLPEHRLGDLRLHASKKALIPTLETLPFRWSFHKDVFYVEDKPLRMIDPSHYEGTLAQQSLRSAMNACEKRPETSVLATLPLSKDQLQGPGGKKALGHTEFFRQVYGIQEICMLFYHPKLVMGLLTDHLPLKTAIEALNSSFIEAKVVSTLRSWPFVIPRPRIVYFGGINPHAGEGGLLGSEDEQIELALQGLSQQFSEISFLGPYPSDSLFRELGDQSEYKHSKKLLFFPFHDFGLPLFKALVGIEGLNISLGLPYLRISVDHGTAPHIFGQDRALYQGCSSMLSFALSHYGPH